MLWALEGAGLAALSVLLLAACTDTRTRDTRNSAPSVTATIVERGLIDCFPAGLTNSNGKATTCETSAVARSGGELIFASDKPVPGPGRSSVFVMDGGRAGVVEGSRRYLTPADVLAARKFEAITVTPDKSMILASTAFDRVKPKSSKWDAYNTLLAWPVGREDQVQIVAKSTRDGVASSISIRAQIALALRSEEFPQGAPYFKVEGLAAVPGGRLLFGIREVGKSYKDFNYTMKIVSVSYEAHEASLSLGADFKLTYEFDTSRVGALDGKEVGLSSLEYDPYGDRLYILTSFELEETDAGLGGFLWTLPLDDFDAGRPPRLVLRSDGSPLVFAHKSEGLTIIEEDHLFVVHDDDRVLGCEKTAEKKAQWCRQPHQAAFTIVHLIDTAD